MKIEKQNSTIIMFVIKSLISVNFTVVDAWHNFSIRQGTKLYNNYVKV